MKFNKILFISLTVILLSIAIFPVFAAGLQDAAGQLENVGKAAYGTVPTTPLPKLVGRYIRIFLGLLGVIFAVLMIYGGYNWMTSFGKSEKVDKAKDTIVDATIGLIIVLAAYAITGFVVGELVKRTTT